MDEKSLLAAWSAATMADSRKKEHTRTDELKLKHNLHDPDPNDPTGLTPLDKISFDRKEAEQAISSSGPKKVGGRRGRQMPKKSDQPSAQSHIPLQSMEEDDDEEEEKESDVPRGRMSGKPVPMYEVDL